MAALISALLLSASCPVSVFAQAGGPEVVRAPAAAAAADSGAVVPKEIPTPTNPERADTLAPAAEVSAALDQARELIKSGDYDRAIEILTTAIQQAKSQVEQLREAYLLLIKTRVTYGNYLKSQPQGRAAAQLSYEEARRTIAECLRTRELRHTQPEPASEYPPEMVDFFRQVRGEIFGSFRIVGLQPVGAVALLDADTLRAAPGDSLPGDIDLAVGWHLVVLRAKGYRDVTDEITISPNATLERAYRLTKGRSGRWYAAVAVGAAALVGGVIALVGGNDNGTTAAQEPLPGPPGPPAE